jgi:hypothetical protein
LDNKKLKLSDISGAKRTFWEQELKYSIEIKLYISSKIWSCEIPIYLEISGFGIKESAK